MEKLVPLTVTLPENVFEEIRDHAQTQYLSRSAVARQIIIEELKRRKLTTANVEAEVAA